MNFMQKAIVRLLGLKSKTYTLRDHDFAAMLSGGTTYAGKAVTETTTLQVSAAWACVRIIAETMGALPVAFYQRDRTGNAKKIEHALTPLFTFSPNADMTGVEYIEALALNLALRGNAYSLKEMAGSGRIAALYPIAASRVEPKRRDDGTIYYRVEDRGKWEDTPAEKIWHIKGFGSDGLTGLSPIAYARQSIGTALAVEEFQARFFSKGANPSWIISFPTWLKDTQREAAKKQIRDLWQGLDNAHTAAMLEGGMTATPATMPLQDAQFLQLRELSIQEVCRIYRMPPHMVMDLSRSTNNNIEHQGHEFVTYTMMPYLTRIERSAVKNLLPPGERSEVFMRYNVDALLRADATGRANLYSSALQNGWMTRNEVRAKENLNSSEELDGFTAQANLLPVEAIFDDERRNAAQPGKPPGTVPLGEAPKTLIVNHMPSGGGGDAGGVATYYKHGGPRHAAPELTITVPGLAELATRFAKVLDAREEDSRKHIPEALKSVSNDIAVLVSTTGSEQARAMKVLVDGFAALLDAGQQANKNALESVVLEFAGAIGDLRNEQKAELSAITVALERLTDLAQSDRVLEYDDAGNPVRSRIHLNS